MRYNVVTYLLGEGIRNVFKNKKSSSASIIIMSLTMLIFGVFFVITQNINSIMKQIESEQGIEVFLYDISEDQTKAVEDYIRNIDGVNTVEYKSKEDALNQLKSQFKDRADLLSGYEENNIFPASYVVTLTDLTKSGEVIKKIRSYDEGKCYQFLRNANLNFHLNASYLCMSIQYAIPDILLPMGYPILIPDRQTLTW